SQRGRDRAGHRTTGVDRRRSASPRPGAPPRRPGGCAMRRDFRDDELFDEIRLRRALRLDAAELPPRFDLATVPVRAADLPGSAFAGLLPTDVAGTALARLPS